MNAIIREEHGGDIGTIEESFSSKVRLKFPKYICICVCMCIVYIQTHTYTLSLYIVNRRIL